jgi:hypothetical protein
MLREHAEVDCVSQPAEPYAPNCWLSVSDQGIGIKSHVVAPCLIAFLLWYLFLSQHLSRLRL